VGADEVQEAGVVGHHDGGHVLQGHQVVLHGVCVYVCVCVCVS
jgi:hypothetical protein